MGIGQRTIGKLNRLISALEEPGFRRQQPKVPPAFMPFLKQDIFPIGAPLGAVDVPALTAVHNCVEAPNHLPLIRQSRREFLERPLEYRTQSDARLAKLLGP